MLELGSRIARDIGAEEGRNVTGQWIAHRLAEKIEAAETDPTLESECVDLILKLWSSRRDFPPQGDPFGRYENLLSTLRQYFSDDSGIMAPLRPEDPPENELIDIASDIDTASRHLVKAILKEAFRRTGMEEDELLAMADEVVPDRLTRDIVKVMGLPFADDERESEESAVQEEISFGKPEGNETDYAGLPDDVAHTMRQLDEAVRRYKKMQSGPKDG